MMSRAKFVLIAGLITAGVAPSQAQERSSLLDELDRSHIGVRAERHVHSHGYVEGVDMDQGTITVWHWELESPDKSVWMPSMRMVFHVTNRALLKGLGPGHEVDFQAVRLRNALMITRVRKVR